MDWFQAKTCVTMFLVLINTAHASDYSYEKRKSNTQVVHILNVNPKKYQVDIVRAHNDSGRETVPAIARHAKADIAINGGFFAIDDHKNKYAMPSGTLIVKGHVHHLINKKQSLVVIKPKTISIVQANPKKYISNPISIVSGIPLLIRDGNILQELKHKKSNFYTGQHARTALGVKSDGSIVIVVVENHYKVDLLGITMEEIQSLMQQKGKIFSGKYPHHSPSESKPMVRGFTILELARLMKTLGCQHAINLDGGGSSTLYIKGKTVNQTIGDIDEGNGLQMIRPVSDAIIFKKYNLDS